ncbi:unnamed protein product [Paramecium primaurelia]|uniref:Uncharacterized protein n=1 Tax=Paramecium primaurelia TaxID=5886 RepID=A0A8S1LXV1_PARPR|nr:unnamed protein product [Paramecium primaurelia]
MESSMDNEERLKFESKMVEEFESFGILVQHLVIRIKQVTKQQMNQDTNIFYSII